MNRNLCLKSISDSPDLLSACGSFTKNKEKIQKFIVRWDSKQIYQNELDKACFKNDMAYGNFKHLPIGTAPDKVLRDKVFDIAKN